MARSAVFAIYALSVLWGSSTIGFKVTLAEEVAESGLAIGDDGLRVRFMGDRKRGFEIAFQRKKGGRWTDVALK